MGYILYSAKEEVSEEQKGGLLSPVAMAAVLQDRRVLVDDKVTMSPQCPYGQEGQWHPGVHREGCDHKVEGDDLSPLLSPSEATSGILCSILHLSRKMRSCWKGSK